MKNIVTIFLFIIISFLSFADQFATTEDGRKVLLKDDGTWEFLRPRSDAGPMQVKIGNAGAVLRILSIRDNVKSSSSFMKPSEGMRFLALEILVDNSRGNDDLNTNFSQGNLDMRDTDGYSYEPTMWSFQIIKPGFPNDVYKGDIGRGWIGFEVKKDVPLRNLRIRYVDTWKKIKTDWIVFK